MVNKVKKKILIVEDEYLISFLMEHYISESCATVIACVDNGDDAIEISKREKPDIILMDIRIEGDKDGIETALEINKNKNIDIIFTSGNSDEITTNRAKKANMLGFLVKPINKEDLLNLICNNN